MCKKCSATNSQPKVEHELLGLTDQSIHPRNTCSPMGQLKAPQLTDKIVALMESEKINLADLLMGLEEERKAIWQERQTDASSPKAS